MRTWLLTLLLAVCGAGWTAPAGLRPLAGLDVRTQVDKVRAVPDDVVTYTVSCRNLGPGNESQIVVQARVTAGLELVPPGPQPAGAWDSALGQVQWRVPLLAANEQTSFSFRARLTDAAPGTRVESKAQVQSAGMERPRESSAVTTEVVPPPLMAAFAIPDVIAARLPGGTPLIDAGAQPGQRVVERLEGLGVVKGFPDGTFRPNSNVTRAEATKMVVAVRQLAGLRDKASVTIALSRPAKLRVVIENSRGSLVRSLADGWQLPAGHHQFVWDGTDAAKQPVGLGVYRYQISGIDAEGVEQTLDGTIHVVTVRPLPDNLTSSFADVPTGAWFHPYVAKAEKDGLVQGYPGGRFNPNVPIRRVENTVLVVRAAGLGPEAEQRCNEALGFSDAASIPRWAVGYVAVATTNGGTAEGRLLVGYVDNRFLPNQNLTRGEAALVLERLLDRDSRSPLPVSGRVAKGHTLTIDGRPVSVTNNGRFRQEFPVKATLELVRVLAR